MTNSTTVKNNSIYFETYQGTARVTFKRTLRIPDDYETYDLPADLGSFPIRDVRDFEGKVPKAWTDRGGIVMPMHELEALWISFFGTFGNFAIKVGVGNVNAISGETLDFDIHPRRDQDYAVLPGQPWLDGIKKGPKEAVCQFVATVMGSGESVEAQVTGEEKYGGFQLALFPPKLGKIPTVTVNVRTNVNDSGTWTWESGGTTVTSKGMFASDDNDMPMMAMASAMPPPSVSKSRSSNYVVTTSSPSDDDDIGETAMNIGAGGKIKQKIYVDPYFHSDVWNTSAVQKLFVNLVSPAYWERLTGTKFSTPVTPEAYNKAGYPMFKIHDGYKSDVAASDKLQDIKTVSQIKADKGEPMPHNSFKKTGEIVQNDW